MDQDRQDADVGVQGLARELQILVGKINTEVVVKYCSQGNLIKLPQVKSLFTRKSSTDDVVIYVAAALRAAIGRLTGDCILHLDRKTPYPVDSASAQKALNLLLPMRRVNSRKSASARREDAIAAVSMDISVDHWRRPSFSSGPELQLMAILAESLLAPAPFQIDKIWVDVKIGLEARVFDITWHLTALQRGEHVLQHVLDVEDRDGRSQPIARIEGARTRVQAIDGFPLNDRYANIRLPDLRVGQRMTVNASFTRTPIMPWIEQRVLLVSTEPAPLKTIVALEFIDDHPHGIVWPFSHLPAGDGIEGSLPGRPQRVTAVGSTLHTFTDPSGLYGLAWEADDIDDMQGLDLVTFMYHSGPELTVYELRNIVRGGWLSS